MNYKFEIIAGIFIRGQIKRELERFLFENTDNYSIKENKTFFESSFFIQFEKRNKEKGEIIYKTIKSWALKLSTNKT